MKKTFIVLLAVLVAICSLTLLTACDKHQHTYSKFVAEKASTCSQEGWVGHYECTECHKYFDPNLKEIESIATEKKSHTYGDLIDGVASSCIEEGYISHYQCASCQGYFDENKNPVATIATECSGHEYGALVASVEPSCFSAGNVEYYECTECHKKFDHNKQEISSVVVAAHGNHNYTSGTCTRCSLPEGVKSVAEAMLVRDKTERVTLRGVVLGYTSTYNGGYVYVVVKDLVSDQICGIRRQVVGDGLDNIETSCVAGDSRNPAGPFAIGSVIEVPVSVNVGTATVGGGKGQILFIYRGENLADHPEMVQTYTVGSSTDLDIAESGAVTTITNQEQLVAFLSGANQWKLVCLKGTAQNPIKMATFTKDDKEDISIEYINFFFHNNVSTKSDAKAAGAYPVLANFGNVAQMNQALSTTLFGQTEYEKTDYTKPNYFVGEIYCMVVGGSTSYFHFVILQENHIHNENNFDGIAITPAAAKNAFFKQMEVKAAQIGINIKSNITSAVGVANVIGCNDLVRMGIAAMKTPAVANIWGQSSVAASYVDNTGTTQNINITNRNVSDMTLQYIPLDQIVGIKGGSLSGTTTSRPYPIANTLIAVKGPDDTVMVIATVMNAADTTECNRYMAAAKVAEILKAKYNNQDTSALEAELDCFAAAGVILPKENAPENGYDWWGTNSTVVNFTYNGDAAITTASCWKVMTALTALDLYDETHFAEEFTVYKSELSSTINSSVPNFQGGEVISYQVAMQSMLLSSSNVAPSAIARFVGEKLVKGEIQPLGTN